MYVPALICLAVLMNSCISIQQTKGPYLPMYGNETVIGTVQTAFVIQTSVLASKNDNEPVNTEIYTKLMETAQQQYPGTIGLRDIVWISGNKSPDGTQVEIHAAAKVIKGIGIAV